MQYSVLMSKTLPLILLYREGKKNQRTNTRENISEVEDWSGNLVKNNESQLGLQFKLETHVF